jgi:hypothetical protein
MASAWGTSWGDSWGDSWGSAAPPTDEAFGGYGPILRIRHRDDEGEILAIISAFMHIQQEE